MIDELDAKRCAEALYDERISSNLDAIEAAGQWGEKTLVPLICKEIFKKIEIKKEDKVLEIGCGSGVLGNYLKKYCAEYYGVDISFKMLQKFFEEYNSERKCTLIQAISDKLPFPTNTFSMVVINGVTMYLHGNDLLEKTLTEIERISTKNAVIFIGENVIPSRIYWEYRWFQNLNYFAQQVAKPYIKIRLWLAQRNSKLVGKWKFFHYAVSPNLIKKFFDGKGQIYLSDAAAMTIKKRKYGKYWKGNRRMDFVIKLGS